MEMNELKRKIIKYLKTLKKYPPSALTDHLIEKWNGTIHIVSKDKTLSDHARREGNALFVQNKHDSIVHHKILQLYNRSAAFAPNESEELAIAYGNRSALLRHVRKYAECIIEIDKALKITESLPLKVKLLCRKAECFTALGSFESKHCVEKAKFLLAKSDDTEKSKKMMSNLIIQTQSIIDIGKLDEPKDNRRKIECLRIIAEAETVDIWNNIKVERNEKYGRHLVAERNFEPGDVIMVEKPYMSHLHEPKRYIYCSQCLNYLWTVIPCDNCSWRLFCSDKCKIEAMKEYHDIECSTLVQIKEASILEKYSMIPFLISAFFKALKEAGSIDRLQKDLKFMDKCEEKSKKGYQSNGKLKEYDIVYNLPLRGTKERDIPWLTEVSVLTLMGLAKYSNIFSINYDFSEIEKLMKNDTAIFVGAFILKTFLLINSRCTTIWLIDPSEEGGIEGKNFSINNLADRLQISYSLRSYGFLTTTRCIPNVHSFITYGNRHVMYALNPIKKGTPLIASAASIEYGTTDLQRQSMYGNINHQLCDCQACSEDWAKILADRDILEASVLAKSEIGAEILEELNQIHEEMEAKSHRINHPDTKLLSKAQSLVAKTWKHFPMPSMITVKAIRMMEGLLARFHTPGNQGLEKIDSCKV